MKDKEKELVIIGMGPAGMAASIYTSRYGIEHVILGNVIGGQISQTHLIDNYPGMEDMTGLDFSEKWLKHIKKYGVETEAVLVENIEKEKDFFILSLNNKKEIKTKSILLATGTKKRNLEIPGEKEFFGRGVSHCATCDGFFYKNKKVAVIGGADSAASAALFLAGIAEKVYLIYRKEELRAESYWVNLIRKNPKIEIIYNTNVLEIKGKEKVEKVFLDKCFQGEYNLKVDGVFIEIGSIPIVDYIGKLGIKLDEMGYIKISPKGETNVSGVFAAGDITTGSDKFCQVITAASEGAIAARAIFEWLKKENIK